MSLTIVIFDGDGYGMLRFDQEHGGDDSFGVDLRSPDFAAWVEATVIPATTVDGVAGDFGPVLERSLSACGVRR